MPWFRRKKREEGAPAEAAPEARAARRRLRRSKIPPRRLRTSRPERRRGSRGGRGRKKTPETARPARSPRRGKAGRQAEAGAREREARDPGAEASPTHRRRRRKTPTKRIALPDVKKEIFVSVEVGEQRVAVLEDGKPAEVYLERPGDRSIAGNVYKGVVDNVLPGMEASFVDIGLDRRTASSTSTRSSSPSSRASATASRIQELIQRGQEVLVQAVKDPMGTKGARLTTEISLPGRFLVYTPFGDGIGISRRLEDDERERLKAICKSLDLARGRASSSAPPPRAPPRRSSRATSRFLRKLWSTIKGRAARARTRRRSSTRRPSCPLRIVRDLFIRDFERVVVDHERTYRRIVGYLKRTSPRARRAGRALRGQGAACMEKSGVERGGQSTLDRRVDLPSGGYLIFDYAEAFTVIDVNTGRFVGARGKASGARLEDTITKNNLEAVAGGRAPAPPPRHRRDHRHRLHRHGEPEEPRSSSRRR